MGFLTHIFSRFYLCYSNSYKANNLKVQNIAMVLLPTVIHEVLNQSYKGRLKNRLDSPGMSLKPRQRFKHSVNASGSQGSLICEVPTCLWLVRGKPTLEPPTCTAFGNQVAKSGMPFQTQLQAILGLRVLRLAIVKYQENEISFVRSLTILF